MTVFFITIFEEFMLELQFLPVYKAKRRCFPTVLITEPRWIKDLESNKTVKCPDSIWYDGRELDSVV